MTQEQLTEYLLHDWKRVSRTWLFNEEGTKILSYYDELACAYWYHDRFDGFLWPKKGVISCDAFVDRESVPEGCVLMVFDGGEEMFCCDRADWKRRRTEFCTPLAGILVMECSLEIFRAMNKHTGTWRNCE